MAPSPPWADLDQEILGRVFRLLPSIADLARASAVCRSWRSVALQNPPPLPWLLMPSPNGASYFRVFGETTHQLPQVPDHARGARFCCSFPGGWVLVELPGSADLELLNIYDGTRRIELPDHLRHQDAYHPMVIYAATMSAAPTPDAGAGACIVAAITAEENRVAFWRSGMGFWWSREVLPEEAQHGAAWLALRFHLAQDVMYYRGAPRHPDVHGDFFCVLTDTEDLLWYEPGDGEGGALTMRVRETQCHSRERMVTPASSGLVVARYLLVSGEDLLMVKRFYVQGRDAGTISATVYCLQERGYEDGPPFGGHFWEPRLRVTGQLLFIGRGCSRAFRTGGASRGYIYFLDDVDLDPPAILRGIDTGRYRCFSPDIQRRLPSELWSQSWPWIWYFDSA